MNKKLMPDSLKLLSVSASSITLYEFYNKIQDEDLKRQISKLQIENKNLSDKLFKDEIAEIKDELTKLKLDSCKDQLIQACDNIKQDSDILSQINPESLNAIPETKTHLEQALPVILNSKKTNEILDKITDILHAQIGRAGAPGSVNGPAAKNKFWGDEEWFTFLKEFINQWQLHAELLSTLNLEQLGALANLTSALVVLLCLFTIMGIVYTEFLLIYFKIDEKYPRLSRFLKIRKLFQHYYLFINFLIIILILLAIIVVNIKVLLL